MFHSATSRMSDMRSFILNHTYLKHVYTQQTMLRYTSLKMNRSTVNYTVQNNKVQEVDSRILHSPHISAPALTSKYLPSPCSCLLHLINICHSPPSPTLTLYDPPFSAHIGPLAPLFRRQRHPHAAIRFTEPRNDRTRRILMV